MPLTFHDVLRLSKVDESALRDLLPECWQRRAIKTMLKTREAVA